MIDLKKIIKEELLRIQVEEAWSGRMKEYIIDPTETSQEYKTEQAVSEFQKFYRTLDVDTRYTFSQWLRRSLLKSISVEEAANIASKITAASKAFKEPVNKNQ